MWNELFGWVAILASLGMGLFMGVKFRREDWLGGYGAFPRRMVRLAHVALAALGMLNILFAESLTRLHLRSDLATLASLAFITAAILMPTCCLCLAARRRHFGIFALPVGSLAAGLILTIGGLLR